MKHLFLAIIVANITFLAYGGDPIVQERINKELIKAATKNNLIQVNESLSKGANPGYRNNNGETALTIALSNGYIAMVPLLINANSANIPTKKGKTPLMLAVDHVGYPEMVPLLLGAGASPDFPDSNADTALTIALKNKRPEMIPLLATSVTIDLPNKEGQTPLMIAAALYNNHSIIKLLIDAKANLNAQDNNGDTALMVALKNKNTEIVPFLTTPFNVNLPNKKKQTSLMVAATYYNNDPKIIPLLLNAGADQNLQDINGDTALIIALSNKNLALVPLLITPATINRPNKKGQTPLAIAADLRLPQAIRSLLSSGANPYAQATNGQTIIERHKIVGDEIENLINQYIDPLLSKAPY